MRIAHISDFHLFAGANVPPLIRPDIVSAVEKIIADMAAFPQPFDACMLTGDLAGHAVIEDYLLLRKLLLPLDMPVFPVPGNHDAREPFREAFADWLPFEDDIFLHYETRIGPLRVIALDTMLNGEGDGGELCPRRLQWAAGKLAAPFDGVTYVLMHHPPYTTGVTYLDGIGLVRGREEFGRMIAAAPGEVRILCGHIHRPSCTCWNGAFAMVGGSPAFTIELDLSGSPIEPSLENAPYAYFIHSLDESGEFAVSPRYVDI